MYAVFKDGGKQYRASSGDRIEIELRDAAPGQEIQFDQVLMVSDGGGNIRVGQPLVEGATVVGKIEGHEKGKKTYSVHFRRKKNSRSKKGHRQQFTRVIVEEIRA
ncbi:MAG TPA: 50S ribosomal protein L21 [Candidatus Brocadiia bacterium]|nr:50S ribosomal protein L21 [Candidatus Brocadiia bacterium]